MTNPPSQPPAVAIVGGGVAGLTVAWLLQRVVDVHLFERNDYAGGHTRTIVIPDGPDAGTAIDIGFIVMNHRNYPLLTRLFKQLAVDLGDSDMSFGYSCERTGYAYSGSGLGGLFARTTNLVSADHWRLLRDIVAFNRDAVRQLRAGALAGVTLGQYLDSRRYSRAFADHYLLAMGAAIWSAPAADIRDFPALPFVRFFHNHGLLTLDDRPAWKYVKGGSQRYVQTMLRSFRGTLHLNARIAGIRRGPAGACLRFADGSEATFSHLVLAAHADESLALLDDPSPSEREWLGAWRYQANETVLHTDTTVLPPATRAWASWNFCRVAEGDAQKPVSVTYDMNRLQQLGTRARYLVTLNRTARIPEAQRVYSTVFTHPMYSFASLASQDKLRELNGSANTYYCGSYLGYGFHEDAVRSAVDVATHFGVSL
ncbi:MAG: FAD-dependent oxidoreductase [Lentisphaerae bacterium]|nr:FAD-dependent oxidoreductase [Lentisphaerota bacterium]